MYSVGGDGRVIQWTVVRDDMRRVDIIKLSLDNPDLGPDGTFMEALGKHGVITKKGVIPTLMMKSSEMRRLKLIQNTYSVTGSISLLRV